MPDARTYPNPHLKAACANCSVLELCLPLGLSGPEIERLDTLIVQRFKVKKGAALYRTGDPLRSLYAVRIGSFKTSMVSIDGREQVTGFQISGEMLGLDAISADEHACSAFALEDSEVCPIHFAQLEKLAQDLPSLQHSLNKLLSREIVRDHSMLMLMGNMNSDERLAAFLLNLSQRLSLRGYSSRDFILKMRREEIGSYLGLRLETICRGIAHLRDQGLVEISGREVKVLNLEGLKQLVAGCQRSALR
ncbi:MULTISPECIES: fumarate/nitrate reduction transcriptional regulator Fnr [Pseudomonas]|jgi:cAMP-binding proteins - catabolite gene activator and regulatory subunit of cAMP-dependent protein kinases|uniref:fumarate/nitrate reduction transcriptional regulator Fnr n=1 Tax=Pseudomonas TaxID=286 RepID=UPI0008C96D9A|nr:MULTISPECIES: fumarate/nitrate reduction transcriptional regulator Fnr [Pseudomonas]MCP1478819.1 CRP/FNR family transcriptional regulator [Pseudomonas chlororaphis]MCP1594829.1 CRP/FNR family transcriptional regulator [Pseudomonas chlororaphis]ROL77964.1 Crp/Fnr family transcriptional regulator [Pseudomonas chlororaphis]ROL83698.1 Crp/Fnr family transcriptional regulator [Pseudomonas chlororaphis]RON80047.1 Crp/Fnr family transcriptional regulator [Pseudomonas chlororaphis]